MHASNFTFGRRNIYDYIQSSNSYVQNGQILFITSEQPWQISSNKFSDSDTSDAIQNAIDEPRSYLTFQFYFAATGHQ